MEVIKKQELNLSVIGRLSLLFSFIKCNKRKLRWPDEIRLLSLWIFLLVLKFFSLLIYKNKSNLAPRNKLMFNFVVRQILVWKDIFLSQKVQSSLWAHMILDSICGPIVAGEFWRKTSSYRVHFVKYIDKKSCSFMKDCKFIGLF